MSSRVGDAVVSVANHGLPLLSRFQLLGGATSRGYHSLAGLGQRVTRAVAESPVLDDTLPIVHGTTLDRGPPLTEVVDETTGEKKYVFKVGPPLFFAQSKDPKDPKNAKPAIDYSLGDCTSMNRPGEVPSEKDTSVVYVGRLAKRGAKLADSTLLRTTSLTTPHPAVVPGTEVEVKEIWKVDGRTKKPVEQIPLERKVKREIPKKPEPSSGFLGNLFGSFLGR